MRQKILRAAHLISHGAANAKAPAMMHHHVPPNTLIDPTAATVSRDASRALERSMHGHCSECGEAVELARLARLPSATLCESCAQHADFAVAAHTD
jgi:hypothetical protein